MTSVVPENSEPCLICDFMAGAEPVYEDDLWFAGIFEPIQVPGWLVLSLKRHAFDPMGMTDAEAEQFGPVVKRLTTAMQAALGSERVYVLAWGETAQHLHFLVSSRGADIPPEHRHAEFWVNREQYADPEAAADAAARVREALLAATSSPTTEEVV